MVDADFPTIIVKLELLGQKSTKKYVQNQVYCSISLYGCPIRVEEAISL